MSDDEYLSIVDESGREIGKELRSVVYEKGMKNYRVVNIFIINSNGEILIQKRTMDRKLFPGRFDFAVGEHINFGERYESGAYRGLQEELNLSSKDCKLEMVEEIHPSQGTSAFMQVFVGKCDSKISPSKDEGVEYVKFLHIDEIEKMLIEDRKQFKSDFYPVFMICKDKIKKFCED